MTRLSYLTRFVQLTIILQFFSMLALLPPSEAAVIYTQGTISGATDVLNTGTLIIATDLGGGAPAVNVNGVAFGPDSGAGLVGFVHGDPGDFSTQFPAGSPLDLLLSELVYQNHGLGSASLTLSGLTAGTPYLLQMFLCNESNSTAQQSRISIQGQAYNIAGFGDNPTYIRAYFTASGSSETIQFGNGSSFEPNRMILNAFALSAVPEPSSFTLLGLGSALLVFRRKLAA